LIVASFHVRKRSNAFGDSEPESQSAALVKNFTGTCPPAGAAGPGNVIGNLLSKSGVGSYIYALVGSALPHAVTGISSRPSARASPATQRQPDLGSPSQLHLLRQAIVDQARCSTARGANFFAFLYLKV
jgi:hypothetical protein